MPFEPYYAENAGAVNLYKSRTMRKHIGTFYMHAGKLYIGGFLSAEYFSNECWQLRGILDMANLIERICRNNADFVGFVVDMEGKRIHVFIDTWRLAQVHIEPGRMYRTRSGSMAQLNYHVPCER